MALKNGQLEIVRSSLLGSMLSNLLFVLGLCFLLGGIRYPIQKFNVTAAKTSASMLTLSAATIVLPTAIEHLQIKDRDSSDLKDLLTMSRAASILLLVSYLFYLVFQLKTHSYLYQDEVGEDEEEESKLNVVTAAFLLATASILVSISVDAVVGSIEDLSKSWGISNTFVALILLPIAGNAPGKYGS